MASTLTVTQRVLSHSIIAFNSDYERRSFYSSFVRNYCSQGLQQQFTVSELKDDDILSDIVPSNIVSRQVRAN